MVRLGVGILVGLAVGFAVGWVVFGDPFGSSEPTQADVERAAAREAGKGYATCNQRQNPPNVWDCKTANDEPHGTIGSCDFYVATISDSRVVVRARQPSGINDTLQAC